jgi:SAM-dependent methyltransferase
MGRTLDKYKLYHNSVQNPDADIDAMKKAWRLRYKDSMFQTLREDFCGTFANTVAWVSKNRLNYGIGIDLDNEPINYGKKNYLASLTTEQQTRIKILHANVLSLKLPRADVVCAFNFSYYCFHERKVLLAYFKSVFKKLNKKGMFVLDCLGGSLTQLANDHKKRFPREKYTYHFEQLSFDPIHSRAKFAIHFKFKTGKSLMNAFTYDWRMWTIPEIRELLEEAGFKTSKVFWEGLTKKGEGSGVYRVKEKGEECESWIAYIAAYKS